MNKILDAAVKIIVCVSLAVLAALAMRELLSGLDEYQDAKFDAPVWCVLKADTKTVLLETRGRVYLDSIAYKNMGATTIPEDWICVQLPEQQEQTHD